MSQTTTMNFGCFEEAKVVLQPTVLLDAPTRYDAEIVTNDVPLRWLADAIDSAITQSSYHEVNVELTIPGEEGEEPLVLDNMADIFMAAAKVAIGARLAQCNGKTRFDKKNFEYVSLLGPVLGMYGIYHDSGEAYDIWPVMGPELREDLKRLRAIDEKGNFIVPDWYADANFLFRKFKLFTNFGLPKETTVDTNCMFKLSVDNNAIVGKPGMSTAAVLISALVHSSKLTDLFGSYRTLYTGISTLRTTFETIGLKALHALDG